MSRGAVTNAIPRGLLVEADGGKIETEHPLAVRYLADHKAERERDAPPPKSAPKKSRPADPPSSPTVPPAAGALDPIAIVGLKDKRLAADIDLKRVMRRKHELDIATKKGQLIPRDVVRQELASFDAALKTNLRDLPRRCSAQLHAIALADGARGLEAALEREIGQAIERSKVEA